ncbi:hemagglutinin repeat-containing protein [Glaciimonas sp. PAMC28666]|uniref:hemagglutinin repeat-containing protein n=1 Tax=Glaciimonas sp. PAMC28666 TaxID=2807626 RepID=UPI001966A007|nr:hemagglutinin repeat-containing protein [Glaciimonas sp. PAMC28666]QRX83428.1 hemagglutinin repeat-containing protein [Glaciimonas sp. PAMC28666]
MNKNTFKLVWSRHQKCLVPVGENCTISGKSSGETASVMGKVIAITTLLPMLGWSTTLTPTTGVSGPTVTASQNGQPVVNITQANAGGLSVNQFSKMNVTNGLIINNSLVNAISKTGGQVMKNPNITSSSSAVLLQNVGSTAAAIAGTVESFGQPLDLFVSSPAGLSLNGVSTVNISSATFSTGQPSDVSGAKPILNVSGGALTVGTQGINTTGLDYLALIARSITVSGPITDSTGKADLKLIAGTNQYDANTGKYIAQSPGASAAPLAGISGTDAGSMYGNNVLLVSTEAGAGVNQSGLIKSQKDIQVSANGDVMVAQANAGGNLTLSGQAVTAGRGGAQDGLVAGQALTVTATKAALFNSDATASTILVTAQDVTLTTAVLSGTSTQAGNAVTIVSQGDVAITGKLRVINSSGTVIPQDSAMIQNGVLVIVDAQLQPVLGDSINSTGGVVSRSGVSIQAARDVSNLKGVISAGTNVQVAAAGAVNNTGAIDAANGAVNITSSSLDNAFSIASTADINLTTKTLLNEGSSGIVAGGKLNVALGGAAINAGALNGDQVSITSSGGGAASLLEKISGSINTTKNLTITLDDLTNYGNIITGTSDTSGTATYTISGELANYSTPDTVLSNTGNLLTYGAMSITAQNVTNTNAIAAAKAADQKPAYLTVTTTALNNGAGAAISSSNDMLIQAASIDNSGQINATGAATLSATKDFNNTGNTAVGSSAYVYGATLNLSAQNLVNTAGSEVEATAGLNVVTTAGITNAGSQIVSDAGALTLQAGTSIHNSAAGIVSGNTVAMNATGSILNDSLAAIQGVRQVTLTTANVVNDNALVRAGGLDVNGDVQTGNVNVSASGGISNTGGAKIQSIGQLTLTAANVVNDSATLQAGGTDANGVVQLANLTITTNGPSASANAVANTGSGSITASGDMKISAQNADITNGSSATIQGGGLLTLTAQNGNTNNSGQLQAGKAATISAGQNVNNTGNNSGMGKSAYVYGTTVNVSAQNVSNTGGAGIEASGAVNVTTTAAITNTAAQIISDSAGLTLQAGTSVHNSTNGLLSGNTAVAITSGSTLTNDSGAKIQGIGQLTLTAANVVNDSATLQAGGTDANGVVQLANLTVIASGADGTQSALTNTNAGILNANGDVTLTAQRGSIANTGKAQIQGGGQLMLTANNGSIANTTGATMQGITAVSLSASTVVNDGATIQAGGKDAKGAVQVGNLTVIASGADGTQSALTNTNAGILNANGDVTLTAQRGSIANTGKAQIQGGGQLTLTANNGSIANTGKAQIQGGGQLMLTANNGSIANTTGATMQGITAVSLSASTVVNDGATIQAGGKDAKGAVQVGNLTVIASGADGTQSALTNTNAGILNANGDVTLTAQRGSIANTGKAQIQGGGQLMLTANNGSIANTTGATMQGITAVSLSASTVVNDGATIQAGGADATGVVQVGNLTVIASGTDGTQSALTNSNAGVLNANGDVTLTAQRGSIANTGNAQIQGGGQLTLTANNGSIANTTGATMQGITAVSLSASTVVNDGATIQAGGADATGVVQVANLTVSASGVDGALSAVENTNAGVIIATGALTLAAQNGSISNLKSAGMQGIKAVSLSAVTVVNDGATIQAGGVDATGMVQVGDMTINASGVDGTQSVLSNTNAGMISASGDLSLNASKGSISNLNGATIQGTTAELVADVAITNDNATLSASDSVTATAATVSNTGSKGTIAANMIRVDAKTLTNAAAINATDTVLMNTTSFTNTATGTIKAGNEWTVNTDNYSNVAPVGAESSQNNATVTFKGGEDVDLTKLNILPIADTLLTLNAHKVTVDIVVANPGGIQVNAGGAVVNNQALESGITLGITAAGDVTNNANGLLWGIKDVKIQTPGTLENSATGTIQAGGNLIVDANVLNNNSTESGSYTAGSTGNANGEHYDDNGAGGTDYQVDLKGIQTLASTLKLVQGVLQADGNIILNEGVQKGKSGTLNNSGNILAGGSVQINGNINNLSKPLNLTLLDLLKTPTQIQLTVVQKSLVGKLPGAYQPNFSSVYEMLNSLLAGPSSYYFWGAYKAYNSQFMHALSQATGNGTLTSILNTALGADWNAQDYNTLRSRWATTVLNATTLPGQEFLPAQQVTINAGGNIVLDAGSGAVNNGDGAGQHMMQSSTATIGPKNLPTTTGALTAPINQVATVTGALTASINHVALTQSLSPFDSSDVSSGDTHTTGSAKADISKGNVRVYTIENLKAFLGNTHTYTVNTLPTYLRGKSAPLVALGTKVSVASVAPLIFPVYSTSFAYVDQTQYYGTAYFFASVGYNPGVQVATAFDNYTTTQDISRLVRSKLNQTETLSGAALVENLMDNAGTVAGPLGLTVGVAPTAAQLKGLTENIVWYVSEMLDNQSVLIPEVYLSQAAVDAENAASSTGGATLSAQGVISLSANANGITNVNGSIHAGNGVMLQSAGNITNIADGGINGGITSNKGVSLKALGNITNAGASIVGHDVSLRAGGQITDTAQVGYDAKGKVAIVNKGTISADSTAGTLNMHAGNGIALTAANLSGNNINIDAGAGKVETKTLNIVSSSYTSEHKQGTGYNVNNTDTESQSNAAGTTITAGKTGTLNMTGQGITLTGGTYTGGNAVIDAKDGNLVIAASQDYGYENKTASSVGFVVSAQAGMGDASASAAYSTIPGVGGTTSASMNDGTNKSAPVGTTNAQGSLGNASEGLEFKNSTDTMSQMTNQNATLSFGNSITLKSANTVDIGGADLTSDADTGSINITAGNVASTKYVDTMSATHEDSSVTLGYNQEQHSSIKKLADDTMELAQKMKSGQTKDAGTGALEAGTYVGDATNLVFGDTYGASANLKVGYEQTTTSKSTTQENTTNLNAGKITITSTKGNIDLNGVQSKSNDLALDSAGDVNITAAKGTSTSHSDDFNISANVTGSLSTNAAFGSAGVGVTGGVAGGDSKTDTSGQTYTNSNLLSKNVSITAKNDLNLTGANVKGDSVALKVGGNTTITSVQDVADSTTTGWSANLSGGASIGDHGLMPMGSVGASGTHSWDNSSTTKQQSGIEATQTLNANLAGNVNLSGAHLVSDTGNGQVTVGGKVTATKLVDTVDKDGNGGGGQIGMAADGIPSGDVSYTKDDQIHRSEVQNATIGVTNLTVGGVKITDANKGTLNTDATKLSVVTDDRHIAGSTMDISAGAAPSKKPLKLEDPKPPVHPGLEPVPVPVDKPVEPKLVQSDLIETKAPVEPKLVQNDLIETKAPVEPPKLKQNDLIETKAPVEPPKLKQNDLIETKAPVEPPKLKQNDLIETKAPIEPPKLKQNDLIETKAPIEPPKLKQNDLIETKAPIEPPKLKQNDLIETKAPVPPVNPQLLRKPITDAVYAVHDKTTVELTNILQKINKMSKEELQTLKRDGIQPPMVKTVDGNYTPPRIYSAKEFADAYKGKVLVGESYQNNGKQQIGIRLTPEPFDKVSREVVVRDASGGFPEKVDKPYQEPSNDKGQIAKNTVNLNKSIKESLDFEKAKATYKIALTAHNAATVENVKTTTANTKAKTEFDKAKTTYDNALKAHQEATATNVEITTANTTAKTEFDKAKTTYDNALKAHQEATATNVEITTANTTAKTESDKAKTTYDNELKAHQEATATNVEITTANTTAKTEFDKAKTTYDNELKAHQEATATNVEITTANTTAKTEFDKAKTTYDNELKAHQEATATNVKITTANTTAKTEFDKTKTTYDNELKAHQEATATNVEITTANTTAKTEFDKTKTTYDNELKAHQEATAKNVETTNANNQAGLEHQQAVIDHAAAMVLYNQNLVDIAAANQRNAVIDATHAQAVDAHTVIVENNALLRTQDAAAQRRQSIPWPFRLLF